MRSNRHLLPILLLLIVVAAIYRVIPGRLGGFAPQLAMAIFAGAVIKDKKWAFALPIFSMFLSDLFYQFLFNNGLSAIGGFYRGQITNYVLFAALTGIGFLMKKISVVNIIVYSLIGALGFFVVSNFLVWINGGGWFRPRTFAGLVMCYEDGLPFLQGSIFATLLFSGIFFGAWKLLEARRKIATA